ncbi:MAG TPA: hypothetical protein PLT82_03350 [Candidatus Hydrogenedens sp.]|nr:hypothetical protein [Candidatus Hydrogenedens sp.]HOL20296.1 hypothetical protein [Candidatus Hydrogenedens sp.]HPP58148.1 hypothetical protein [Candidatus Hydrogenedens sp.]
MKSTKLLLMGLAVFILITASGCRPTLFLEPSTLDFGSSEQQKHLRYGMVV